MENKSNGSGFMGLLAIVFIVLKLTNYIAWSWWWVLAPLWAPFILFILAIVFLTALYFVTKK